MDDAPALLWEMIEEVTMRSTWPTQLCLAATCKYMAARWPLLVTQLPIDPWYPPPRALTRFKSLRHPANLSWLPPICLQELLPLAGQFTELSVGVAGAMTSPEQWRAAKDLLQQATRLVSLRGPAEMLLHLPGRPSWPQLTELVVHSISDQPIHQLFSRLGPLRVLRVSSDGAILDGDGLLRFPHLEVLDMSGSIMSDSVQLTLPSLTRLRDLVVGPGLGRIGQVLPRLTTLTSLSLASAAETPVVQALSSLPCLEHLSLGEDSMFIVGPASLAWTTRLLTLAVRRSTRLVHEQLATMTRLTTLLLHETRMGWHPLAGLDQLSRLTDLDVQNDISGGPNNHIFLHPALARTLRRLRLGGTLWVSDLPSLYSLTDLRVGAATILAPHRPVDLTKLTNLTHLRLEWLDATEMRETFASVPLPPSWQHLNHVPIHQVMGRSVYGPNLVSPAEQARPAAGAPAGSDHK